MKSGTVWAVASRAWAAVTRTPRARASMICGCRISALQPALQIDPIEALRDGGVDAPASPGAIHPGLPAAKPDADEAGGLLRPGSDRGDERAGAGQRDHEHAVVGDAGLRVEGAREEYRAIGPLASSMPA